MPEFVGEDAGAIIPYGDTEAFSTSILDFYADRDKLEASGQAARQKIASQFSKDAACRKIEEILLSADPSQ
jgi:glycosyltransferase involved in cell wall biosynthesis